jgi:hypothetical protein
VLTEAQRRCEGIPVTYDANTHEPATPVGMFVVVALECPLCRVLTTRWWVWRGVLTHVAPDYPIKERRT